jgi:hypothetical protein
MKELRINKKQISTDSIFIVMLDWLKHINKEFPEF